MFDQYIPPKDAIAKMSKREVVSVAQSLGIQVRPEMAANDCRRRIESWRFECARQRALNKIGV
jgi:hypothetical protein